MITSTFILKVDLFPPNDPYILMWFNFVCVEGMGAGAGGRNK